MSQKTNILIDQGTDFSTSLNLSNDDESVVNLTGYTARAQIRKHYSSETAIDFDIAFGVPRSSGVLTLSLDASQTASMEEGQYVYDLTLTSSANNTSRLVEGMVIVSPRVTR